VSGKDERFSSPGPGAPHLPLVPSPIAHRHCQAAEQLTARPPMSFSDLTRSFTTFPTASSTPTAVRASSASSQTAPADYSYTPRTATTTYSYASEGPSNVPGRSIAAGSTAVVVQSSSASAGATSSSSGGVDGLALGLGLGLGLGALLTVLVRPVVFARALRAVELNPRSR